MTTGMEWVERLNLEPHPEGGFFRQTYRAAESIPAEALPGRFSGARAFSTAIYYLLTAGTFSALHRIHSDEGWHFYAGSELSIYVISPDGSRSIFQLGTNGRDGFQVIIPAGSWFGACVDDPGGYALVGCTVAPGFEYTDFELGSRADLLSLFPQAADWVERLTR